jgi:hypothetical protein
MRARKYVSRRECARSIWPGVSSERRRREARSAGDQEEGCVGGLRVEGRMCVR